MTDGINVLSLFDGISCGQIALQRAGIKVANYFASEIDKYAIKVTQRNWPNTVQLGSVVDVDIGKLPEIDLVFGGSPCQSFSFLGKRKGMSTKCEQEVLSLEQYLDLKSQNFKFDGQSYLFWEYVRILRDVGPKHFLLENTRMAKKWENVISSALGASPIEINSALFSAQNRRRLYWTDIPFSTEISDMGVKAIDIKDGTDDFILASTLGRKKTGKYIIHLDKMPTLTNSCGGPNGLGRPFWTKCSFAVEKPFDHSKVKRITPIEAERLQTVPDNYTACLSNNKRYHALGNSWTVDVIAHIFGALPQEWKTS